MKSFDLPPLDGQIVNRTKSFFAEDLIANQSVLSEMIEGSRILVIGGAGSIGSHTLRTILSFAPSVMHVVDHNENGLAELVRSIRSSADPVRTGEILTLPFDYGGAPFKRWLAAQKSSYDYVLNFAALKHVRSEKDPFSILAMLETNVVKLLDLASGLNALGSPKRLFCVSTDKAANPSSMMGATKRMMEHALFATQAGWDIHTAISSARFANVAMSNGSLLQSWQMRQSTRQPMACPEGCRRFFVSLDESGHLCTLAGFLGADRNIMVPTLDPSRHLVLLQDVATWFLEAQGLEPWFTYDEEEALNSVSACIERQQWPVLLTPLDTAGEKPYEEFYSAYEKVRPTSFDSLNRVDYVPPENSESFPMFLELLRELLNTNSSMTVSEQLLKDAIATVEPSFAETHRTSTKSLDNRI